MANTAYQPGFGQSPSRNNPIALAIMVSAALVVALVAIAAIVSHGDSDGSNLANNPGGGGGGRDYGTYVPRSSTHSYQSDRNSDSADPDTSDDSDSPASLYNSVQALYDGLNRAWENGQASKDYTQVGLYVSEHNDPVLKYTASECTPESNAGIVVYKPLLSSLRADPSFTSVSTGRYKGMPISSKPWALMVYQYDNGKSSAPINAHVSVDGDRVSFFFICE